MQVGSTVEDMMPMWYAGGKEYDGLCQNFSNVIRTASKRELLQQNWHATLDGKMAQIVLCDQLARNAFRGTPDAFAGDEAAMDIARELSQELIKVDLAALGETQEGCLNLPSFDGIMYPPYLQFIVSPLMHSERKDDHSLALEVLDISLSVAPDNLKPSFQYTKQVELEHKVVIDQFGRYPHRNEKLGRESTPEELKWLQMSDLPEWAKSQA
jgi:uncharacterized protein (DUF924 family)